MAKQTKTTKADWLDRSKPRVNHDPHEVHECRPGEAPATPSVDLPDRLDGAISECRPGRVVRPDPSEERALAMFGRGVDLLDILRGTGLKTDQLVALLGLKNSLSPAEVRDLEFKRANAHLGIKPVNTEKWSV